MAKTLTDLNELLFQQLETLSDHELKGDALMEEITRAEAITNVAEHVIDNANTLLSALKLQNNAMDAMLQLPPVLK